MAIAKALGFLFWVNERHKRIVAHMDGVRGLVSRLFVFSSRLVQFCGFVSFRCVASFRENSLRSTAGVVTRKEYCVLSLRGGGQRRVGGVITVLRRVSLPSVVLLAESTGALLLERRRRYESTRDGEDSKWKEQDRIVGEVGGLANKLSSCDLETYKCSGRGVLGTMDRYISTVNSLAVTRDLVTEGRLSDIVRGVCGHDPSAGVDAVPGSLWRHFRTR